MYFLLAYLPSEIVSQILCASNLIEAAVFPTTVLPDSDVIRVTRSFGRTVHDKRGFTKRHEAVRPSAAARPHKVRYITAVNATKSIPSSDSEK